MITNVYNMKSMKINIRPKMLLGELKDQFNSMFPYLMLVFYRKPGDVKTGKRVSENYRIGDVQTLNIDSSIEISPGMTVKELEDHFEKNFSLITQVFRKSVATWLQTTLTDDWTLERQNEHGREISEGGKPKRIDQPVDYDLDRDADH